jgi:hypothetical protein
MTPPTRAHVQMLALWQGLGAEIPRGVAMNATMMATREIVAPFNARTF